MSRNVISLPGVWLPGRLKKRGWMALALNSGSPSQQLVLLRELVPLLAGLHAEQGKLPGLVALADSQLEAPRESWSIVA
jgi:hypothetical protein